MQANVNISLDLVVEAVRAPGVRKKANADRPAKIV